jgi:hypothetical protein
LIDSAGAFWYCESGITLLGPGGREEHPHAPPGGFAGFAAWALSSGETEKPARMAGFFFSYSISSEYHMERINRPTIFEGIRV